MAYKSVQEMLDDLEYYNSIIEEIPKTFEVHDEYLIDGMRAADFIEGYRTYRDVIKKLNLEMLASPENFGLLASDRKGIVKPVNSMNYPYLWLFTALVRAGDIKKGVLYVNGTMFLEYVKGKKFSDRDTIPKNVEWLMLRLTDYGFDIAGYKHGESVDFTVEYRSIPYMIPAIKASTLSRYQEKSFISDYACFNTLMFKIAPKEKMAFADTHTAKHHLNTQQVEYLTTLISELGKLGFNQIAERHHEPSVGWMKFKPCQVYYQTVGHRPFIKGMSFRTDLGGLTKNEKYLETLPEKFINAITDGAKSKCRGCKKGKCNHLYAGELFGKKSAWCNVAGLRLDGSDIDDIPYLIDIIVNIHGKNKKV